MRFSHVQCHFLLQAVKCDFCLLCLLDICCHRVSVRLFFCHKPEFYQTATFRITQKTLQDIPATVVFLMQKISTIIYEIPMESPNGGTICVGKSCVLRPDQKCSCADALTPKICVHPPRWCASTTVSWQENTRCHQHLTLMLVEI